MQSRTAYRFLALVLLALIPLTPARADTREGVPHWFAETGHTLAYAFRQFYDGNGGLTMFGYPLTEVFVEAGRPVQYFERARLEWHADMGMVLAGHLGRWAAEAHAQHPAMQPLSAAPVPANDRDYFPETRHTLGGAFRAYWHTHGGLPVFGYPLSEEFTERNVEDGQEYVVQYFERARFELHPDLPQAYQVSLGHLGRRYLEQHPAPAWSLERVPNADAAWAGVRPTRITLDRIGIDTAITAAGSLGKEWDVPRYTAAYYWPVSAYPGTQGNVVVAGHVGYKDTIFNRLPEAQVGDEIVVYTGETPHRYVVREILTLLPSAIWVMLPTSSETLTLITCVPIKVYSHRLVVRAEPIR